MIRAIVPLLVLLTLSCSCEQAERKTSRTFPHPKVQPLDTVEGYTRSDSGIVVPKYEMIIRPRGRLHLKGTDVDLDLRGNRVRTYEILNDRYFLVTLFHDTLKGSKKLYLLAKDDIRVVSLENPQAAYEAKLGGAYIIDVDEKLNAVIAGKFGIGNVEIPMHRLSGEASKQPETSPPSPEMIERLIQTALDFEGLNAFYHPGVPGRDTLEVCGWDLPEGISLVQHGNPVVFVDTCAKDRNCIDVERFGFVRDSAYMVLWYPIESVRCKLSYRVDHEDLVLLSHTLMEY